MLNNLESVPAKINVLLFPLVMIIVLLPVTQLTQIVPAHFILFFSESS